MTICDKLPKNKNFDKIINLFRFIKIHKALPKKTTFNGYYFFIKTSNELRLALRQFTSDKEFVKIYLKSVVGKKYIVPTIAVLRSKKEVIEYSFPVKCVVKPTHACGLIDFISYKNKPDKKLYTEWMDLNYYFLSREPNYENLSPKIIIEPFIFNQKSIDDIKVFCFNGHVKLIQWDFDRHTNHTRRLYTRSWKPISGSMGYPPSVKTKTKPKNLDEIIKIAETISCQFNSVRVDMYINKRENKILVGELTHCHGGSFEKFIPPSSEKEICKIIFS